MSDSKMFRLTISDTDRIDELVERVRSLSETLGIKKIKQTTMLRALIFHGAKIDEDDLIMAIKDANIYT